MELFKENTVYLMKIYFLIYIFPFKMLCNKKNIFLSS